MLDLRFSRSPAAPDAAGIPSVGSAVQQGNSVQQSSPILESTAKAPSRIHIGGLQPHEDERTLLVAAIVSIAIAGVAGLIATYLRVQEDQRVLSESKRFDEQIQEFATGSTGEQLLRLQDTSRQLDALQTFLQAPVSWPNILDAFAQEVPSGVGIATANFDGETRLLSVDGSAATFEALSTFIASLNDAELFADVALQNASRATEDTGSRVTFSLSARYVASQPVAQPAAQGLQGRQ